MDQEVLYFPETNAVDKYFGKKISDPYRLMENEKDSLVIGWYKNQNTISNNILNTISSHNSLFDELNSKNQNDTYLIKKVKVTNNDRYFYLKKTGKDTNYKLYYKKGFKGKEDLLFDPKTFNKEDDSYLINYIQPNWEGSKIVISLTNEGKEISEIIILDTQSKKIDPEIIKNCWPSALGGVRWLSDNSGFFYEHIPVIDRTAEKYLLNVETVLYELGKDPKKLNVYFSRKNNPEISFKQEDFPEVIIKNQHDEYIFSNVSGASPFYDYYYTSIGSLKEKKPVWKTLFKKEDLIKRFFVDGDTMIYLSAKGASNFKICKTSLKNPNIDNPKILIEEDSLATITDITLTKQGLFFVKTRNGVEAKLYHLKEGKIKNISIPKPSGYINVLSKNANYNDLWIEIEGWASKRERYRYDYATNSFEKEPLNNFQENTSLENIVIKEEEITSHDGEKVPLSIIYSKGIELNGKNRVLMTGYGAYGTTFKPRLSNYIEQWIKQKGIYVIAHVRGGGEKGNLWHKGGYKETKSNSWKDFIACTEYLISEKYTSSKYISAWGASAGGILIGRAITERPDLFNVAMIRAGMMNPLRSETAPNGKNNIKEFGTVKKINEFKALLEMDSYHNIKNGVKYPALLLTAGMNDPRVTTWIPGKFAARLQKATASEKPVLFLVDFEGGHGLSTTKSKKNEEVANFLSFALWQTGHPEYQLKK
ncbi:prolyl oligopeptidase family serine peptidase [Aquimarina longa]|uniref:prolyl oligopeptidase family serine peptidase n=1 Tax=Aquimarina longa TaxID=1080221 RepID=UPI00130EE26F|nr:prolyl oligopeptidase family serine peptidase [Aquimarina longa]